MIYQNYILSHSIKDAINHLENSQGHGIIIAGGTDLILKLKRNPLPGSNLVDISRIPELSTIREEESKFSVGSAVTFSQIERSRFMKKKAAALFESASAVGSAQIRNVGTIGGNVVSARPAADSAIALTAFDARAYISNGHEVRDNPILDLYQGLNRSKIDPSREILSHFEIAMPNTGAWGSAFMKLGSRKALSLPILNCAVVIGLEEDIISKCRIVVGPVAPTPCRMNASEDLLRGQRPSPNLIEEAAQKAKEFAEPRESRLRGSTAYRKDMVRVLVRRCIHLALERAKAA